MLSSFIRKITLGDIEQFQIIEKHILDHQIYIYNKNKVIIYDDCLLKKAYDNKSIIKNYNFFINNPKYIQFYSIDEAIKTGHNIYSSIDHELYQIIIKDNLVNELWIPGYIDEDLPLIEQNEVQSILSEVGLFRKKLKSNSILDVVLHGKNNVNLRNKSVISYEVF